MDKYLKILEQNELEDAKLIYRNLFEDPQEFIDYFYKEYKNNCVYYGGFLNNELVFITTMVKKRIFLNNQKEEAFLIVGVGTKKEYQRQGLMKYFLPKILNSYPDNTPIFIQSLDWAKYSNFNFFPCTIKSSWILRKDQILHKKKDPLFEKINYDLINEIRNRFNITNSIKNFSYRTNKENKKILKMHLIGGDKIYQTNRAYVIIAEGYIMEYGYIELIDLIKLISNFEYGLKIRSFIDLDKKYFTKIDEEEFIETKILNKKNITINFSEFF